MTRPPPTVLGHLAIAGLRPEILAEVRNRDRHQKRRPCRCESCRVKAELFEAAAATTRQLGSRP